MSSNTEVRRSRIPGVRDAPESADDVTSAEDAFEPEESSEPETDQEHSATGDGGDPYPVPGSGARPR